MIPISYLSWLPALSLMILADPTRSYRDVYTLLHLSFALMNVLVTIRSLYLLVRAVGTLPQTWQPPYPSAAAVYRSGQPGLPILPGRPGSTPVPSGTVPVPPHGPAAVEVTGHAPVEHFPGSETATALRAVRDAVAAHTVHVPRGGARERFMAAGAVLELHPGDPVTTGPAGPSHDHSYVLIF